MIELSLNKKERIEQLNTLADTLTRTGWWANGRIRTKCNGHRLADARGILAVHYIIIDLVAPGVFESKMGHQIHHSDENIYNNKPSNLVLCPSESYHRLLHIRMKALKESGNANKKQCKYCRLWDLAENMKKKKGVHTFYHRVCHNAYNLGNKRVQDQRYKLCEEIDLLKGDK